MNWDSGSNLFVIRYDYVLVLEAVIINEHVLGHHAPGNSFWGAIYGIHGHIWLI